MLHTFTQALIILLAFLILGPFPEQAQAEAQALFNQGQGTVLIQGYDDQDALLLWQAMQSEISEDPSFLTKDLHFDTPEGQPQMHLTCQQFKKLPKHGSCSLTLFSSRQSLIDESRRVLTLEIKGKIDAAIYASAFKETPTALIFRSVDSRLQITKSKNAIGEILSFSLRYKE